MGEDIGDDSGEVRAISFLYNHSVLDVASGSTHSCAIIKDDPNNRIDCWGRNGSNQMGLGHTNHIGDQVGEFRDTQVNKSPSYDHDTFGNPVSIHARYYTTCVLTDTQRLVCWGQNNKGQLGRNSGDNHGVPGLVELKDSNGDYVNITKVAVGGRHVCAVSDLNEVFCWGSNITSNTNGNEPGVLGHGSDAANDIGDGAGVNFPEMTGLQASDLGFGPDNTIIDIQADEHTCVIYEDNMDSNKKKMKCWGRNNKGQLGKGDKNFNGGNGTMGTNLDIVDLAGLSNDPLMLSLGNCSSCVIDTQRYLHCWGKEHNGNLGAPQTPDGDVISVPNWESRVFK